MAAHGREVIVHAALIGAVPGTTILGSSARRAAVGSLPGAAAAVPASALPGPSTVRSSYLLSLYPFTSGGLGAEPPAICLGQAAVLVEWRSPSKDNARHGIRRRNDQLGKERRTS